MSLLFLLFPRWYTRREMRKAIWTAFLTTAAEQKLHDRPIQFSAKDFNAWQWIWRRLRETEQERDQLVELLDRSSKHVVELKAALVRESKR